MANLTVVPASERTPLSDLIEDYLVAKRAEGRARRTLDQVYRPVLERVFLPWCRDQDIHEIGQVTQRALDRLSAHLHDQGGAKGALAPASIHSYMRTINGFLSWAKAEGELGTAAKGRLPKLPHKIVHVLSREEIQRMEDAAQIERDGLIVRVLADTGMRVGELCGLRLGSLVREGRDFLEVAGRSQGGGAKGDRGRLVPLTPSLAGRLRRYVRSQRPKDDVRSDHIFVSLRKGRKGDYEQLQPSGVLQLVKELAYRAGIEDKKVTPHVFRHSFITWQLRRGTNIEVIRRIVGHADTSLISSVYGHLVNADLHEALMQSMTDE